MFNSFEAQEHCYIHEYMKFSSSFYFVENWIERKIELINNKCNYQMVSKMWKIKFIYCYKRFVSICKQKLAF